MTSLPPLGVEPPPPSPSQPPSSSPPPPLKPAAQATTSIYLPKWSLASSTRGHPVRKTKKNKVLVQIPAFYPCKPSVLVPRPSAPHFILKLDVKASSTISRCKPGANSLPNSLSPSQSESQSESQSDSTGDKASLPSFIVNKQAESERGADTTRAAKSNLNGINEGMNKCNGSKRHDKSGDATLGALTGKKDESCSTVSLFAMPEKPLVNDDEFVLDTCNPNHAAAFSPVINLHLLHRRYMHLHPVYLNDNEYTPKSRLHGVLGICDVCNSFDNVPVEASFGYKSQASTRVVAVEVIEWDCIGEKDVRGYVVTGDLDSRTVDIEFLRSMDNEAIGYALRTLFWRRKKGKWPRRVVYCKSSRLYCDYFHRWFREHCVKKTKVAPRPGSKLNPRLEAHILCTHRMVNCAMKDMKVPDKCWPWALGWALRQKSYIHLFYPPCHCFYYVPPFYKKYYDPELGPYVFGSVVYKYREIGQRLVFDKDAVVGIFVGMNDDGLVVFNPDAEPGTPVRKNVENAWVNEALTWEEYKSNKEAYTPQRIFDRNIQLKGFYPKP